MSDWLKLILAVIIVASCGVSKDVISSETNSKSSLKIVKDAASFIGTPYKYAGTSRRGMDCSGLSRTVYNMSAIEIPRTTSAQARIGRKVVQKEAKPGDLIFFNRGGRVFHVGIVSKVSRGKIWMIHASSSKGVVEQEVLSNSYWRPKLHQIRKVI